MQGSSLLGKFFGALWNGSQGRRLCHSTINVWNALGWSKLEEILLVEASSDQPGRQAFLLGVLAHRWRPMVFLCLHDRIQRRVREVHVHSSILLRWKEETRLDLLWFMHASRHDQRDSGWAWQLSYFLRRNSQNVLSQWSYQVRHHYYKSWWVNMDKLVSRTKKFATFGLLSFNVQFSKLH